MEKVRIEHILEEIYVSKRIVDRKLGEVIEEDNLVYSCIQDNLGAPKETDWMKWAIILLSRKIQSLREKYSYHG